MGRAPGSAHRCRRGDGRATALTEILIRPAAPSDAEPVAALIAEVPGGLSEVVGSLEAALPLARRAFLSPRTAFGFPFVLVATEGDGVLAQMSRFPGSAWRRLRVGTGVSMVLGGSPRAAWRLTWRGRVADRTMDPVPRDRLYVASLGVRADRRGQGIGGRLLAIACQEATASGLRAVALDVAASNERAIGFYLREGFAVVAERRHPATRGLPPGGAVRMERPAR